jgi:hypothetical protein
MRAPPCCAENVLKNAITRLALPAAKLALTGNT